MSRRTVTPFGKITFCPSLETVTGENADRLDAALAVGRVVGEPVVGFATVGFEPVAGWVTPEFVGLPGVGRFTVAPVFG
jgi:hypothetical protein